MPRAKRQKLSYFPLDTDFLHTKHIKALRREYGPVGILTYLSILCRVYGTGGYYYAFQDCQALCMDITEEIANHNLTAVSRNVDGALHYLVEHKIFDEKLFLQNVITSKALQEQFIVSTHKWRRKLNMDAYLLVDVNEVLQANGYNVTEAPENAAKTEVSDTEGTQRKGNERKGNEKDITTHSLPEGVVLTSEEYRDILEKIPNGKSYIERFAKRITQNGYRYADHHKAILDWWESDKHKECVVKGSFDTDEFAGIALQNSMELARKKGEDSNGTI